MTTIHEWCEKVHAISRAKGWWDDFEAQNFRRFMSPSRPQFPADSKYAADRSKYSEAFERAFARYVTTQIALVISECSEAVEEVRRGRYLTRWEDGKPEGLPIELADAAIRIFDLAAGLGIDLEAAIEEKTAYNAKRELRHGGKLV